MIGSIQFLRGSGFIIWQVVGKDISLDLKMDSSTAPEVAKKIREAIRLAGTIDEDNPDENADYSPLLINVILRSSDNKNATVSFNVSTTHTSIHLPHVFAEDKVLDEEFSITNEELLLIARALESNAS